MQWEVLVSKYKNKILNTAVIILALIIANNIYKNQNKAVKLLREKRDTEIKRNELLSSIGQLDKKIKAYKDFFSNKDTSSVINNISNIAKDLNVKIISIKPQSEQAYPMYIKCGFNLTISVSDYHALGKFISKLENSQDIYMIEPFTISPQFEGSQEAGLKGLSVVLTVSTFLAKD